MSASEQKNKQVGKRPEVTGALVGAAKKFLEESDGVRGALKT